MKPEIDKTQYSTYRVPFVEEFVPGFEYEKVSFALTENTKIPIAGLCKARVGNTILKARVLDIGKLEGTAHVKFLEPGHSESYMKTMGFDYNHETLEDKSFPVDLLYNAEGFEEPYVFFKSTTQYWQKHSYIKGVYKKDHLKEMLSKGNIIAKGQHVYFPSNSPYYDSWLTVFINRKPISPDIKIYTKTKEWEPPEHWKDYTLLYKNKNNLLCAEKFHNDVDLANYVENNDITPVKAFQKLRGSPTCTEHVKTASKEQIEAHIQQLKVEQSMSTKELREKLLEGYILCFIFNGLKVEVKPPIATTATYDFSKSVFINDKALAKLDHESEDFAKWFGKDGSAKTYHSFKEEFYSLINPRINNWYFNDEKKTLSKHLYNIRATKSGETSFYTITYKTDKKPTETQKEILREFTEDRAKYAFVLKNRHAEDVIIKIKKNET